MKIIFSFPDRWLNYNCSSCQGLCCNLNATLVFSNKQIKQIKDLHFLRDYMIVDNDNTKIVCGKKCWFLKNSHCSLNDMAKPHGCKLYPVNIWKLHDEIVVADIIPCPQMFFDEENGISYSESTIYIKELCDCVSVPFGKFDEIIIKENNIDADERISKYVIWRDKFWMECKKNTDDIMKVLFTQIPISPVIFYLKNIDYDEIFVYYWRICEDLRQTYGSDSIYNCYIIARNTTIKYALYKYYFPYNSMVYEEMDERERTEYIDLFEMGYNSKYDKIIDRFYYANGSKWRLRE